MEYSIEIIQKNNNKIRWKKDSQIGGKKNARKIEPVVGDARERQWEKKSCGHPSLSPLPFYFYFTIISLRGLRATTSRAHAPSPTRYPIHHTHPAWGDSPTDKGPGARGPRYINGNPSFGSCFRWPWTTGVLSYCRNLTEGKHGIKTTFSLVTYYCCCYIVEWSFVQHIQQKSPSAPVSNFRRNKFNIIHNACL